MPGGGVDRNGCIRLNNQRTPRHPSRRRNDNVPPAWHPCSASSDYLGEPATVLRVKDRSTTGRRARVRKGRRVSTVLGRCSTLGLLLVGNKFGEAIQCVGPILGVAIDPIRSLA